MVHVLVIEDDEAVRVSLTEALKILGYTAVSAVNGREGIEMCHEGSYDLVITDLVMPEKDGVETILELKLDFPHIKIVAMSGGVNNIDIMDTTYQLGADCALIKPFSMSDLSACLSRVLGSS